MDIAVEAQAFSMQRRPMKGVSHEATKAEALEAEVLDAASLNYVENAALA